MPPPDAPRQGRKNNYHVSNIIKIGIFVLLSLLLCTCNKETIPSLHPFNSAFKIAGELRLKNISIGDVGAFTIDSKGMIYVLDRMNNHIKKYDQQGNIISTIGSPGKGPGFFALPFMITCDANDQLYVLDLAQSRVNVFDVGGKLQHSFLFSTVGFSGITMAVSDSGDIYLGGQQKLKGSSSPMIHKFDQNGKYLTSFFTIDEKVEKLHLGIVGGVRIAIGSNNTIFAAQEVNPRIFKFSSTGELLKIIGRNPPFYKVPIQFPYFKYPEDKEKAMKLLDEFTQSNELITFTDSKNKFVLIAYSVNKPNRYALEVYDEFGNLKVESIGTDAIPIMADRQGNVYFTKFSSDRSDDRNDKDNPVILLKCTFVNNGRAK